MKECLRILAKLTNLHFQDSLVMPVDIRQITLEVTFCTHHLTSFSLSSVTLASGYLLAEMYLGLFSNEKYKFFQTVSERIANNVVS
jgi:hypothetical protein